MPGPSFLTDGGGQQWQIGVLETGVGRAAYTLAAVAGSGATSLLLQDTVTSTIYALTIFLASAGKPELEITPSSGSPVTVTMVALSGAVYNLVVINGAIAVAGSTAPIAPVAFGAIGRKTWASPGYGSKIFMSTDGVKYQPVAQLKSFIPQGSKQTVLDQTNVLTPDSFSRPLAVMVDSGEIELQGVLDPQNSGILQLGSAHVSLAVCFFKIVLADGTEYDFQALVTDYVPFSVTYNKFISFSARLRVSGAFAGPGGRA